MYDTCIIVYLPSRQLPSKQLVIALVRLLQNVMKPKTPKVDEISRQLDAFRCHQGKSR